jgi:hypothetical protein
MAKGFMVLGFTEDSVLVIISFEHPVKPVSQYSACKGLYKWRVSISLGFCMTKMESMKLVIMRRRPRGRHAQKMRPSGRDIT